MRNEVERDSTDSAGTDIRQTTGADQPLRRSASGAPPNPLVTVVMAAHNAQTHVRQAVDSIVAQTLVDFELIVVDDASTDQTAAIVQSHEDARVTLISLPRNRGCAAARNAGLRRARGKFLAIMDADDVSHHDRLRQQTEWLRHHPQTDIVGAQIRVIDGDGKAVGRRRYPLEHTRIVRSMPRWNPLAHSTVMARTDILAQIGGYGEDVAVCCDYDLWSRLVRAGAGFHNLPSTLVDYRIHAQSIKSTRLRESLKGTLAIQAKYWADPLTFRNRAYRCLEHLLVVLPGSFAGRAFVLLRYRLPTRAVDLRRRLIGR